jgi:hypothetical protein
VANTPVVVVAVVVANTPVVVASATPIRATINVAAITADIAATARMAYDTVPMDTVAGVVGSIAKLEQQAAATGGTATILSARATIRPAILVSSQFPVAATSKPSSAPGAEFQGLRVHPSPITNIPALAVRERQSGLFRWHSRRRR